MNIISKPSILAYPPFAFFAPDVLKKLIMIFFGPCVSKALKTIIHNNCSKLYGVAHNHQCCGLHQGPIPPNLFALYTIQINSHAMCSTKIKFIVSLCIHLQNANATYFTYILLPIFICKAYFIILLCT